MSDEEEWSSGHRLSAADLRAHAAGGSGVEPYMASEIIAARARIDALEAEAVQAERAGMERAAKVSEGYTHSMGPHVAWVIRRILRNTEPGGEWQPPFSEETS